MPITLFGKEDYSMSENPTYLLLLGALLILSYPIGCLVAKFGSAVCRMVFLVGAVGVLVGWAGYWGTDDHRFFILIACGIGLKVAYLVSSFKNKKPAKRRYLDLWASREHR